MSDLTKLLIESWTFFKRNIRSICSIIMPFVVPLAIFQLLMEYFYPGTIGTAYLLSYMLSFAAYPIYQGAMILYLASVVTGSYLPSNQYYQLAAKSWLALMVLYFFASIAILTGLILLIIPGLIVMGRLAFSEFYCIFDNSRGDDALAESWRETKSAQGILISGITIIYLCTLLAIYVLGYGLTTLFQDNTLATFVTNIISSALMPLVTIFAFRVYTLDDKRLNKLNNTKFVNNDIS